MGGEAGMPAAGGNGALCADVTCGYGQHCVAGDCASICDDGEVFCSGSCIDPKTSGLFCGASGSCDEGAGPNGQTPPLGTGGEGAGGAGGADAGSNPDAGERCADGFSCQAGKCTYQGLAPGSDAVVTRNGFSVQCKEWVDDVCVKPWLQIPLAAVKTVPDCGEGFDTTALRPVWVYDEGVEEASTFCWVATGNSNYRSLSVEAAQAEECGWMYGTFYEPQLDCQDFRRYSPVDSPGDIPDITWSFDLLSGDGCRIGNYTSFQCYWGE